MLHVQAGATTAAAYHIEALVCKYAASYASLTIFWLLPLWPIHLPLFESKCRLRQLRREVLHWAVAEGLQELKDLSHAGFWIDDQQVVPLPVLIQTDREEQHKLSGIKTTADVRYKLRRDMFASLRQLRLEPRTEAAALAAVEAAQAELETGTKAEAQRILDDGDLNAAIQVGPIGKGAACNFLGTWGLGQRLSSPGTCLKPSFCFSKKQSALMPPTEWPLGLQFDQPVRALLPRHLAHHLSGHLPAPLQPQVRHQRAQLAHRLAPPAASGSGRRAAVEAAVAARPAAEAPGRH